MGAAADIVKGAVELCLLPLDLLPAWLGLLIVAVVSSVIALLAVKWTTDQVALQRARDRMTACLYEIRIFMDQPGRVFRIQAQLAKWSAIYAGRTLPALFLMIIPLGLVYVHLELRYGYQPFPVGEDVLVRLTLSKAGDLPDVVLKSDDLEVRSDPIFADDGQRLYVDVRPKKPGPGLVQFAIGDQIVDKQVVAGREQQLVSPERRRGAAAWIAIGNEPALPAQGPVERIELVHEAHALQVLGMDWWLYWLIGTIVAAFALRRPMGVVI